MSRSEPTNAAVRVSMIPVLGFGYAKNVHIFLAMKRAAMDFCGSTVRTRVMICGPSQACVDPMKVFMASSWRWV